jgi:hypothetical protein
MVTQIVSVIVTAARSAAGRQRPAPGHGVDSRGVIAMRRFAVIAARFWMGCASLGRALVLAVGVPGIVPSRRRGKRPGRRSAARPGTRALSPGFRGRHMDVQPPADDHLRPAAGRDGPATGHMNRVIGDPTTPPPWKPGWRAVPLIIRS